MIDLFYPILPKRGIPRIHLIEESRKSRRKAYERAYHLKNRERRLALMKARYEKHKAEYIANAKAWAAQNPEKSRKIKRANKLRKKAKSWTPTTP